MGLPVAKLLKRVMSTEPARSFTYTRNYKNTKHVTMQAGRARWQAKLFSETTEGACELLGESATAGSCMKKLMNCGVCEMREC